MGQVVKIYLPAKTVTQSGYGNTRFWLLEFECDDTDYKNQLTGWNGSRNTSKQIRIKFNSCEEAEKYAVKNKLKYKIISHAIQKIKLKSYSENFTK
ncbi:MAG: ETC complex I subunit [Rickettsiaceae bacterium H1]|nr:ETC complex I subunit [Rickettsiaceae bacterium H1]